MRELTGLIGLQVISTSEGRRLGTIADALIDLARGELVCVTLARTPELQVVLAEDIEVIGPDAIMVAARDRIKSREELSDELERGKSVLSEPPAVVTNRGTQLGRLGPVTIDEGSFRVVRFEVTGGALKDMTEGVLALPVLEGIVHGEDTVIVPHEVVAKRIEQSGGLRGSFRSLAERLRGGYEDLSVKLGESGEKLKTGASQARERADELTKSAREKADRIASDAKQSIDEARATARERAEDDEGAEGQEPEAEVSEATKARVEEAMAQSQAGEDQAEADDTGEEKPQAADVPDEEQSQEETEKQLAPERATPLPEGDEKPDEAAPSADNTDDSEQP